MRTTADSVARGEPTCAGILVHFRPNHSSIPCADLRLEINRAARASWGKPSRKWIRSASGSFTSGPGSRIQAVFLPLEP